MPFIKETSLTFDYKDNLLVIVNIVLRGKIIKVYIVSNIISK